MTEPRDEWAWLRDKAFGPDFINFLTVQSQEYWAATEKWRGTIEALSGEARAMIPPAETGVAWDGGGWTYTEEYDHGAEYRALRRSRDGEIETVLDLNDLAAESSYGRFGFVEVSPDQSVVAYSLDLLGNESYAFFLRDLTTGQVILVDTDVYYGAAWSPGGSSFFYLRHDVAFRPSELWSITLTTSPPRPQMHYHEPDIRFHLGLRGSDAGLVLSAAARLTTQEWFLAESDSTPRLVPITERREGHVYAATPILRDDELRFLVVSDFETIDSRLYEVGPGNTEPTAWRVLLEESPGRRLYRAELDGDTVIVEARRDVQPRLLIFPWGQSDHLLEISSSFPDGTLSRGRSVGTGEIVVASESYLDPLHVEAVSPRTGVRRTVWRRDLPNFEREEFVSERRTATARDRTTLPYTLVRHRDTPVDGTAPCLYYGYGAWETVIEPAFDPVLISLLRRGLLYVHAYPRGGGELGRSWWLSGRTENKINSFTDFIDIGQEIGDSLVDPQRIVIRGRSAGGLLVGGALSLRPDLWAGVLAEVPFVDPITTMCDADAPLVAVEWDEWGDPRRAVGRSLMQVWSPFDNPPPVPRPRVLATSTRFDSRVSIWEPARWTARLQSDGSSPASVLFRANLGPGAHAVPEGRFRGVDYLAEIYAWVLDVMGEA